MSLGGILILLVLLVSVIVSIYLIVVTARTWGILHTLLLSVLFIECWVFLVMSAGVYGSRVRLTKRVAEQRARAEQAEARTQQLMWGTFDADNLNLEAVVPTRGELRRITNDRGRVWRKVNLVQTDNGSFQLELATNQPVADDLSADPAAAQPATPSSESLPVDLVVYAFAEEMSEDGSPIPSFYLGEYKVTQSQDGAVTLEPTLELSPVQQTRIQNGGATSWSLYELLPVDSHTAFAAAGSGSTDEAIFGRMDEAEIAELFASVPTENGRQQRLIQSYLHDGQPADNNDPPESVWVQLNMTNSEDIDVDSSQDANAEKQSFFDDFGRAIDVRLKRGGEDETAVVKLDPNVKERIVMKANAAQSLISKGVAELAQRFYVRELVDYQQAFNLHANRMKELEEQIKIYQRETAMLQRANQQGQTVIADEQVQFGKLNTDLENYRRELAVVEDASKQASEELAALKSKLGSLYNQIQSRAY